MADVSKLQVVVGADTREAETALGRLSNTISSGFGIGVGIKLVEGGLNALSAGIKASIGEAATFEQRLSAIKAVSGATADEMERLSKLSLQLGADTSFSATEAAKGIEELVKGGVALSDIMGGAAKASLDLAAAGEIDVAEAATIAANAMAQFGVKGSEMGKVSDLIAGAANASSLSVGDFKYSLQAAGAVAATVGFKFEDLAQGIAIMGKAGITGSDAGTSLKTMMMSLAPSTDKAKNLMRDLGIITKDGANAFFDASGKVKSMADVAGVLQKATKDMTEQQRLSTLQTLFGSDAIRAAAVLAKEGAEGFAAMADAMGKVTAASVAEERLNNLSGSLEKLKGSLSTVAITVGTVMLAPLKQLVDYGTDLINAWAPTIQEFANKIPGAIDATVRVIRGLAEQFLPPLTNQIRANFRLISALWGPIFGTVSNTLSGPFKAAISWVAKVGLPAITTATNAVATVLETYLPPAIALVSSVFQTVLRPALEWITGTGIPLLTTGFGLITSAITTYVLPPLQTLWQWLSSAIPAALTWLSEVGWPLLSGAATTAINWLATEGVAMLSAVWGWLSTAIPAALTWLAETGWPMLQTAAGVVIGWVTGTLVPGLVKVWDWLSPKLSAALTWLIDDGWPMLQEAATAVWTWLSTKLMPTLSTLWEWLSPKLYAALNWLIGTGWPMLQSAATTVWAWMTTQLVPTLSGLWEWLSPKLSAAMTWLIGTGWPMLQQAATAVWAWLTGTLFSALSTLWDWLSPKLYAALDWLTNTGWPMLQQAAAAVWAFLTNDLSPAISTLWGWLETNLKTALNWLIDYGWPKVKEGADLVSGAVKATKEWFGELSSALEKKGAYEDINKLWGELSRLGTTILDKIIKPLIPNVGDLTDQFDGFGGAVGFVSGLMTMFVRGARLMVLGLTAIAEHVGGVIATLKSMGEMAMWAMKAAGALVSGDKMPEWKGFEAPKATNWDDLAKGIEEILATPVSGGSNRRVGTPNVGTGGGSVGNIGSVVGGKPGSGGGAGSWFTGGGGGGGNALPGETPTNPVFAPMPPAPALQQPYTTIPRVGEAGPWADYIERIGKEYGVPAPVIASIIDIESDGRQNIESYAMNKNQRTGEWWGRAQGLMQFVPWLNRHMLPGDPVWLNNKGQIQVKLDPDTGELDPAQRRWMQDPENNITLGTRLLAANFAATKNWAKAAAKYFGAYDPETGQITNWGDSGGGTGTSYVSKFKTAMKLYGGEDLLKLANGGWITEPVLGVGRSGQRYLIGEAGPEYVSPARSMASQTISMPITIGGKIIEEIWIQGRDLAVRRGRVPVGATI